MLKTSLRGFLVTSEAVLDGIESAACDITTQVASIGEFLQWIHKSDFSRLRIKHRQKKKSHSQ